MQFMGRWPSPVGTTPRSGYQTDGEPGNDSAGVGTKTHRRGLDENPAPHIVAPDINEDGQTSDRGSRIELKPHIPVSMREQENQVILCCDSSTGITVIWPSIQNQLQPTPTSPSIHPRNSITEARMRGSATQFTVPDGVQFSRARRSEPDWAVFEALVCSDVCRQYTEREPSPFTD